MEKDKAYYESLDKRTKEYKEYKARHEKKSKGLGDTIAKATKATGIDKAVKFIAGEDCGCDERQDKLNKIFSYDTPKCLTEDEFIYLKRFVDNKPEVISVDTQRKILLIHNRIFKEQRKMTSCNTCFIETIKKLEKIMNNY